MDNNRLKALASGEPQFVALYHRICDDFEAEEQAWVAMLRYHGFKAAHPNDGWVDRDAKTVRLAYPQFNDGADAGDLLMLGWPGREERPVRMIAKVPGLLGVDRWQYEDVTMFWDALENRLCIKSEND